ncbi:zinc finger CCCH domain-containing protein 14-like [Mercenaria mercenaria]|uniref:zinc finger CCCH domain-containing protein 14-like n=1 Tax=Mercenaria mercenaria TaxID=6596 RepID=UPI00234F6764|nr:zinc finger CCCH domain-containing protein 14-like [Mercenaria mercenaria]
MTISMKINFRTFPYCKFGDKCVYIHPNCRFDANCTRMDCPYTHSSKRTGLMAPTVIHKIVQVPMQPYIPPVEQYQSMKPQSTQCRFFPNCRNMACPFTHPKPCRYGIGCMSKSTCTFYHPPLPGADKLKWSSAKKKESSDSIAASGTSDVKK